MRLVFFVEFLLCWICGSITVTVFQLFLVYMLIRFHCLHCPSDTWPIVIELENPAQLSPATSLVDIKGLINVCPQS